MISKQFIIKNSQGIHMRPAGILTKAMNQFQAETTIIKEGEKVNAKSIMNVMAACIKFGSEIEVQSEGTDEKEAMEKFTELVESGFGEE